MPLTILAQDFGFLFDIDKSVDYYFTIDADIAWFAIFTARSKYSQIPGVHAWLILVTQGVKFEPSSFKLNHEMVILMGGRHSQGYELFQQLTVKAFLALRPHADQLVSTVQLMLGTGLPSFKGEATIKRLKDRFALGLSERQAAEWMMGIIRNAHENIRSTAYDEFQRVSRISDCVILLADQLHSFRTVRLLAFKAGVDPYSFLLCRHTL